MAFSAYNRLEPSSPILLRKLSIRASHAPTNETALKQLAFPSLLLSCSLTRLHVRALRTPATITCMPTAAPLPTPNKCTLTHNWPAGSS